MKVITKILVLFTLIGVINTRLKAQVSIGSPVNPYEGVLLDMKEKESGPDQANSSKGVLFPKVALKANAELAPLFQTTEDPQKTTSIGMVVYNVTTGGGLSAGLYVWNGSEWISMRGGSNASSGQADLDVIIAESNRYGTLYKNVALTPKDIITLVVNVNRAGSYAIVARPEVDNGYYYAANGEFLNTGSGLTVTLKGVGKPRLSTADKGDGGDTIQLSVNGRDWGILFSDISVDIF